MTQMTPKLHQRATLAIFGETIIYYYPEHTDRTVEKCIKLLRRFCGYLNIFAHCENLSMLEPMCCRPQWNKFQWSSTFIFHFGFMCPNEKIMCEFCVWGCVTCSVDATDEASEEVWPEGSSRLRSNLKKTEKNTVKVSP